MASWGRVREGSGRNKLSMECALGQDILYADAYIRTHKHTHKHAHIHTCDGFRVCNDRPGCGHGGSITHVKREH